MYKIQNTPLFLLEKMHKSLFLVLEILIELICDTVAETKKNAKENFGIQSQNVE